MNNKKKKGKKEMIFVEAFNILHSLFGVWSIDPPKRRRRRRIIMSEGRTNSRPICETYGKNEENDKNGVKYYFGPRNCKCASL